MYLVCMHDSFIFQILMNAVKSDATMSVLTLPVHTNAFVTKATSLILMTKRVFVSRPA